MLEVQRVRNLSPAGRLLGRMLDFEFDFKHGLTNPREINAEERECLRILEEERSKWMNFKKNSDDMERELSAMQARQQKNRGM